MDLAVAFVVGAIVGYGIRAFISARRWARARRDGLVFVPADQVVGKMKPIRSRPSKKPWTETDEKQLLELVDAGKSEAEIGTVLHRTPGAVASHLKRLRTAHSNPSDPETGPH